MVLLKDWRKEEFNDGSDQSLLVFEKMVTIHI